MLQGKLVMSERIKLGITRNRLFEFDNAVLFCCRLTEPFDEGELEKALKMLCAKEPLVTSVVELQDDSQAFVVTESVEQKLNKTPLTQKAVFDYYEKNGIDFSKKLFEFTLASDNYLVVAGHTVVCDAKALLRLGAELSAFYNKKTVSVEPSTVNLFSDMRELPLEVASPITDKLSAELDSKWVKDQQVFSFEDYIKARGNYMQSKSECSELIWVIDEKTITDLQNYSAENGVDVSSLVAFSFYESLVQNVGGNKKYNKMNVYTDQRIFFENFEDYGVGAYNGVVTGSLSKKDTMKSVYERAKQFHLSCYKGITSPFMTFYDESLLMKVSPSLCDCSYMYKGGLVKNKTAKKLAENYGCACEKICDFFTCNLDQMFWGDLNDFSDVDVCEPLKMRSSTYLGFLRRKGKGYVTLRYKKDKISPEQAERILALAKDITGNFTS